MTGDRVAEIRGRVEAGGLNKRDASDLAFLLNMLGLRTAERDYWNTEKAELAAENARLRAQLDTVRELAEDAPLVPVHAGGGNLVNSKRMVSADKLRAALNQGGETNGE